MKFPPVVVVGFSGGVDSTVLLHRFAALRASHGFDLHAVHVNHGLSPSAADWSAHCERFSASLNVPFTALNADASVIREHRDGIEAGARAMRYGLIVPWMRMLGADATLALGHHQDDQAETFLLRALRGSSPAGLGSMREWSVRDGVSVWRPLLRESRDALIAYATSHDLTWIEDPSNAADDFDRNFLRNQVMPLLRSRWPQVSRSFARSAELCDLDSQALDAVDASLLPSLVDLYDGETVLDLQGVRALDAHKRARVVRAWLQSRQLPPLPAHSFDEFERSLLSPREDAQGIVEWSGHQLRVWRSQLHAVNVPNALVMQPQRVQVPPLSVVDVSLSNRSLVTFRNNSSQELEFIVGMREGGEKIRLPRRDHRSSVKNLLNEQTPPWLRTQMPVVRASDGTVWLVGDAVRSEEYGFWQEETGSSIEWRRPLD